MLNLPPATLNLIPARCSCYELLVCASMLNLPSPILTPNLTSLRCSCYELLVCAVNAVLANQELSEGDLAALRSHHGAAVAEDGRYNTLKAASGTGRSSLESCACYFLVQSVCTLFVTARCRPFKNYPEKCLSTLVCSPLTNSGPSRTLFCVLIPSIR